MGSGSKGVLLLQLSVLLVCCFSVFAEVLKPLPPVPPPAEAPGHHQRHHHHHAPPPGHPGVHPPVHPPSYPPAHPPAHPPQNHHHHHHHHGHPPVHPPVKPPVHPPVKPPVYPPVYPPVKPPMHPPVKPPVYPPVKPPPHPPVKPPTYPPVKPPVYAPAHPPVPPPPFHKGQPVRRSYVAVQGVVYCKSCKYAGVDTLLGATPIPGATVKLQCNNTKRPQIVTAKADKNGYFFIQAPKTITSYASHKCKVFVVSSPLNSCNKPSNFHGGLVGSILRPDKPYEANKLPFILYSVGPFAFEPKCPR